MLGGLAPGGVTWAGPAAQERRGLRSWLLRGLLWDARLGPPGPPGRGGGGRRSRRVQGPGPGPLGGSHAQTNQAAPLARDP